MGLGTGDRNRIAKRAAAEISDGMLVNLGIGIPSLVPNHLLNDHKVMFHAENGLVGIGSTPETGKEDAHLCNAGGLPITIRAGASYCDSTVAFGMIRRGRVDITILGALQVSQEGDLANWIVPGKRVPGMGGAMELAAKAKKVIVLMEHNDKAGMSKLVKTCTLPLTAKKCVHMIITELGVFSVTSEGLQLTDVFDTSSIQEIRDRTEASFTVSENIHNLKE
ncbi:3-oxoacid CoA-transferase subunit B [Peribacillus sp. NPDC096622]|uniref:3-oxoacid CoA-transferase subunit B n=1 Tax=Peribacillus sp. NPDC096622 TaxID=3364396 RepID=UPI0027085ECE|nr:3-oxoacid CoA-transferase subunit B [Peribacillus frigoritolerans]